MQCNSEKVGCGIWQPRTPTLTNIYGHWMVVPNNELIFGQESKDKGPKVFKNLDPL